MNYKGLILGIMSARSIFSVIFTVIFDDPNSLFRLLIIDLFIAAYAFYLLCLHYFPRLDDNNILDDIERGETITDMENPRTFTELEISKMNIQENKFKESMFTSCVICLDDFEEGELCSVLPNCKHQAFHKGCLISWFEKGKLNCPICRCKL
ncbi:hypothetical protein ACFE04_003774 [Oxalis oulophora]